jgi:uracil DNA glycosylase
MLVGNQAATRARPYLDDARTPLLTSAHPSPRVKATRRDLWESIPLKWAEVRQFI